MDSGIYFNISEKDYHDLPIEIVSNSYLSRLNQCPAKARIKQKGTSAMLLGRAAHTLTLEGAAAFREKFVIMPEGDKRKKEIRELNETFIKDNPDKDIIDNETYVSICGMAEAVYLHPFAKELLNKGISESTIIWQDEETGITCKCRPDRTPADNKGVLVDLKTTQDAAAFGKAVTSYGYARQAALYTEGVNKITGENYDAFAFIAVEKEPPYRVEVYILDAEYMNWGYEENHRLLRLEKECRDKGFYPHYSCAGANDLFKPIYL